MINSTRYLIAPLLVLSVAVLPGCSVKPITDGASSSGMPADPNNPDPNNPADPNNPIDPKNPTDPSKPKDPTTVTELAALAPFEWQPEGDAFSWKGVSLRIPPGWTQQTYDDGFVMRSSGPKACEIWILDPRDAASSEAALYVQLMDAAKSLLPEGSKTLVADYSDDPLDNRYRGIGGVGWPFVGLSVHYVNGNGATGKPYLAKFGTKTVPVIPIQPVGEKCLDYYGDNDNVLANVWYTIRYEGASKVNESNYAKAILGTWSSVSTSGAIVRSYHESGEFFSGFRIETKGFDPVSGSAEYTYKVIDDVIATFPKKASDTRKALSNYMRIYEEANSSVPSGWIRRLCTMTRSVVEKMQPYESCFRGD
jgi:hypothetical protein